jgi:hypothetical protein
MAIKTLASVALKGMTVEELFVEENVTLESASQFRKFINEELEKIIIDLTLEGH